MRDTTDSHVWAASSLSRPVFGAALPLPGPRAIEFPALEWCP
jgi:hypothetical protein